MKQIIASFAMLCVALPALAQEEVLEALSRLQHRIDRIERLQQAVRDEVLLASARPGEVAAVGDPKSRWPKAIPFPEGAVRYHTAKWTQEPGPNGEVVKVPRSNHEMIWRVPGGMDTVSGWTSDLFRSPSPRVQTWRGQMPGVPFSMSGFKREYLEGAWVYDNLSYRGKSFELRIREFKNGKWDAYVAWKSVENRPPGYTGLKQKCASCHDQAGLPGRPGGHTIFSDPFFELER